MAEINVVLLAAGSASRFGGAKQSALIDGVAMVRRTAQAALDSGAGVIVVTGAHADAVTSALAGLAVERVHNDNWDAGMGGSIACGIAHVMRTAPRATATIVALADQPTIGPAQLRKLIDASRRAPDRIVAAKFADVLGPPCLFPRRYFEDLAALSGMQGARKLLDRHAQDVIAVPMPEAAVDIDTREAYERFLRGG